MNSQRNPLADELIEEFVGNCMAFQKGCRLEKQQRDNKSALRIAVITIQRTKRLMDAPLAACAEYLQVFKFSIAGTAIPLSWYCIQHRSKCL